MAAQAVRLLLRDKLGIRTRYLRSRQGFRVTDTGYGAVFISADLDNETEAVCAADEIEALLREAGYEIDRKPGEWFMRATPATRTEETQ